MTEDPRDLPGRVASRVRPDGLGLTAAEQHAMDLTAELVTVLLRDVFGHGPTREADATELIGHVHAIQNTVLAQAAARAHPGLYRLLGETLDPVASRPPRDLREVREQATAAPLRSVPAPEPAPDPVSEPAPGLEPEPERSVASATSELRPHAYLQPMPPETACAAGGEDGKRCELSIRHPLHAGFDPILHQPDGDEDAPVLDERPPPVRPPLVIQPHRCFTTDGMTIHCLCSTGRDHDEAGYERPDPTGQEG